MGAIVIYGLGIGDCMVLFLGRRIIYWVEVYELASMFMLVL